MLTTYDQAGPYGPETILTIETKEDTLVVLTGIRALMFNNRARKGSSRVLESLQIKPGDVIADIGSGGGYFAFEFAKRVGKDGKVFAVDTNRNLLDYVDAQLKKQQIQNVATVLSNENGFILPDAGCDLMFMRNVFHHLSNAVLYLENIKINLSPMGRIAVIEWRPGVKGFYAMHIEHCTPESEIHEAMSTVGFQHLQSFDFLNKQSFNLFKKGNT